MAWRFRSEASVRHSFRGTHQCWNSIIPNPRSCWTPVGSQERKPRWYNWRPVRITESFVAAVPPEVVFDYMTDPSNLANWQTSKTLVEPLIEGPTRLGTRVRERTKPPGGKEFEQVVEFTEFDRPRRFHVHIVEGPYPIDGSWTFKPTGADTEVTFTAEGELLA